MVLLSNDLPVGHVPQEVALEVPDVWNRPAGQSSHVRSTEDDATGDAFIFFPAGHVLHVVQEVPVNPFKLWYWPPLQLLQERSVVILGIVPFLPAEQVDQEAHVVPVKSLDAWYCP